eukprot:311803-Rhodomonas_salina.1
MEGRSRLGGDAEEGMRGRVEVRRQGGEEALSWAATPRRGGGGMEESSRRGCDAAEGRSYGGECRRRHGGEEAGRRRLGV